MPSNNKTKSQRLDLLLVELQLVESREKAKRLIMAGEVLIDEQVSDKPGKVVAVDANIRLRSPLKYVSRGGLKLEKALDEFQLDVAGTLVADIGASTGGFTDCLLQRGARQVFSIDVGYGQLAWKLRTDDRVVPIERTNVRHLQQLPGKPPPLAELATIDVSFISLRIVLPAVLKLLTDDACIIALIKPQFEAGKDNVGKGGVVREPKIHRRVIHNVFEWARGLSVEPMALTVSPVLGPAGNVEFLVLLQRQAEHEQGDDSQCSDIQTKKAQAEDSQTLEAEDENRARVPDDERAKISQTVDLRTEVKRIDPDIEHSPTARRIRAWNSIQEAGVIDAVLQNAQLLRKRE